MAFPSDSARTKNWGTEILTDADLEGQLDILHSYFVACLNSTTGHSHDGTSNQGPKINITNLTVSSQAQGDIYYASSSSANARLGAGTSGQFLKTQGAGANPTWADVTIPVGATQTEMEAVTSNTAMATPLNMKWHPGVAKAWVYFTNSGTPTIVASHNVSSLTDQGNGDTTVTFTTAFSSANYAAVATAEGQRQYAAISSGGKAAGSVRVITGSGDSANQSDDNTSVVCFGDF